MAGHTEAPLQLRKTTLMMDDHGEREDVVLLEPLNYITRNPGKNIRLQLIDCIQNWLCIPSEYLSIVKEIVTDLHNASLLIDDIEDNSKLRRGSPVAHDVYGIPITLNCANYVYFLAQKKCLHMGSFEAIEAFTEEIINLHRGQGIELFWREHLRCPTEEAYFDMVSDKTGGLFRLAYKLMLPFSSTVKKEDVEKHLKFLDLFGIYFQIRDDLMNILNWENVIGEKNETMHTYCEDITEGKFSFPVIFAILSLAAFSNGANAQSPVTAATSAFAKEYDLTSSFFIPVSADFVSTGVIAANFSSTIALKSSTDVPSIAATS